MDYKHNILTPTNHGLLVNGVSSAIMLKTIESSYERKCKDSYGVYMFMKKAVPKLQSFVSAISLISILGVYNTSTWKVYIKFPNKQEC
jgi:hypothetical protein